MNNSLVITALGSDKPGIVSELTGLVTGYNGNIKESKMLSLGSEFVVMMLVSIDISKQANLIKELKKVDGLNISTKNTKLQKLSTDEEHYKIKLNGADNEGIVNVLSNYLTKESMNIIDLETKIVNAPVTGAPIFNLKAMTTVSKLKNINEIESELSQIANKLGIEISVTNY